MTGLILFALAFTAGVVCTLLTRQTIEAAKTRESLHEFLSQAKYDAGTIYLLTGTCLPGPSDRTRRRQPLILALIANKGNLAHVRFLQDRRGFRGTAHLIDNSRIMDKAALVISILLESNYLGRDRGTRVARVRHITEPDNTIGPLRQCLGGRDVREDVAAALRTLFGGGDILAAVLQERDTVPPTPISMFGETVPPPMSDEQEEPVIWTADMIRGVRGDLGIGPGASPSPDQSIDPLGARGAVLRLLEDDSLRADFPDVFVTRRIDGEADSEATHTDTIIGFPSDDPEGG
jgi:hypothetical protein